MKTNFQANINISPNNEDPLRTALNFLEIYRKEQQIKEDSTYLELRRNTLDTLSNLSNFLVVVSTLLIPLTLGFVNWDREIVNNKTVIWVNLVSSLFLILSIIFGIVHILKTKDYLINLIDFTNKKRKDLSLIKYEIIPEKLDRDKIISHIEIYESTRRKHSEINNEMSKDMKLYYLYAQGISILTALIIIFFSLIYLLSL